MTRKQEIQEEIGNLTNRLFMNSMIDHWTDEDREFDRKTRAKIEVLKEELKNLDE